MNYAQFTLPQFLEDDYFQEWVKNPTPSSDRFWRQFLAEHPEKNEVVNQARLLLQSIDFKKTPDSAIDDEKILYRIKATLKKEEEKPQQYQDDRGQVRTLSVHHKENRKIGFAWQKYAAIFIGVLLVAVAVLFFQQKSEVIYTTAYGQTQKIVLPDSTEIVLNGNSSLRYNTNWRNERTREVWLSGEAYFKVQEILRHKKKHHDQDLLEKECVKFVVHTDMLDVQVVGTQFNVNTRREKTEVVLNSGKVRLKTTDQQEVEMLPGEMISYSPVSGKIAKKLVNPDNYSSWKNNDLVFNEVTLKEVAEILEDTYGLKVIFEDPKLSSRIFKGVFPADNIDILIDALSDIYKVRISRTERKVVFHKE